MKTIKSAKQRTEADRSKLRHSVTDMIWHVREKGDEALKEYNKKFDGCERESLRISRSEIEEAYSQVTAEEAAVIRKAAANIRAFAEAQKKTIGELRDFSPMPGLTLGHRVIPVDSCCCYVPGGGYPLYSTALMLGIPAKTARSRPGGRLLTGNEGNRKNTSQDAGGDGHSGDRRNIRSGRRSSCGSLLLRN